jgi:spore coat protein U-like protein
MKLSSAVKCTLPAAILGFLALGLTPTSAFAATTATANVAVTATVQANCTITTGSMAFGTYTGAAASTTATLTVTCTNTTPYNVGLNAGATSGATVTTRQMLNGTATLNYGLYTNSTWTTNWGNTTGSWVAGTGVGSAQTLTVYGQIPAAQFVTPGSYSDTVLATVNY